MTVTKYFANACLVAALLAAGSATASIVTVTSSADAGGVCPGPNCTLRQAIATAVSGDTIYFAAGISLITLTTAGLLINKNLTIKGPGPSLLSVQRSTAPATPGFRIFEVPVTFNVTISGLAVANGIVVGSSNNHFGGGIFNGGTLNLINCAISGNSTQQSGPGNGGGGIANVGTLTITGSTVSGNTSSSGATDGGGGVFNGGTLTINNSTIWGNSADNSTPGGGGILNSGTLTIANSTISGNNVRNSAGGGGGGLLNTGGTATITNSTITGNLAATGTGGGVSRTGGTVNVGNTIIAVNTAPTAADFSGILTSQGYNLLGNSSGTAITNITTGNQLNVDPKLDTLMDNGGPTLTHALLSASPAIERGSSLGFNADQRGFARPVVSPITVNPVGDGSDIGAYEVQGDILPGCNTISRTVTNNNDDGAGSLRGVIAGVCAGGVITFGASVRGKIDLTSGELAIGKTLTINGPGANVLAVQRSASAGNFRVINVASNTIVTISGLTVANGKTPADAGGGINNSGTLRLISSVISGNSAGNGGGVFNTFGTLTVIDSTISGNTATSLGGGGIFGGTLNVTNSTISGNMAMAGNAGGIVVGKATLTNSTIVGNSASGSGGGIFNNSFAGASVDATNTIVALNTAASGPDVNGALTSQGFNLIGNSSGAIISPLQFSDQIGVTAAQLNLGTLQNNGGPTLTHALLSGSLAIDKGNSSGSTTDQRGFPRPLDLRGIYTNANGGDGGDIGAFEVISIDIDSNNSYDALTDGLLIVRYLSGLIGPSLTGGAVGPAAIRTLPPDIRQYLDSIRASLDVDGNGQFDAPTDGLMIIRYLFGLRGTSLSAGAIGGGASRDPSEIETYIQTLLP